MIWLARRLSTSAGLGPVILTVTGVAVGVALLLLAAGFPTALLAREERTGWTDGRSWEYGPSADTWIASTVDAFGETPIRVVRVHQTPGSPVRVPGSDGTVGDHDVLLSPRLAELVESVPSPLLGDRFVNGSTARVGTIDDQALTYPGELVAIIGVSDAVTDQMSPISGFEVGGSFESYTANSRLLAQLGAVGILVPVAVFIGAALRFSATARTRRLAVVRLVGGSHRQVRTLIVLEAVMAGVVGVAGGFGLFWLTRWMLIRTGWLQRDLLVASELRPPAWSWVALAIAVPLLAAAAGMVAVRNLAISPLGVARRQRSASPGRWRFLPLVIGGVGFAAAMRGSFASDLARTALIVSFGLLIVGLLTSGARITHFAGRLLARFASGPAALIAGRRLQHDPRAGYRAVVGAVLAVFSATFLYAVAVYQPLESGVRPGGVVVSTNDREFSAGVLEQIDSVDGVERIILAEHAEGWQVWLGDCDVRLVVTTACVEEGGSISLDLQPGQTVEWSDGRSFAVPESAPVRTDLSIGAPSAMFQGEPGHVNVIALVTDGSQVTLDRIRTIVNAGETPTDLFTVNGIDETVWNSGLVDPALGTVVDAGLFITLLVAGVSLAVTVAAALVERRLPFALLRMSGVRLVELRRVVLLEALVPLAMSSALGMVLGYLAAATFSGRAFGRLPALEPDAMLRIAAGVVLAGLMTTAVLPLLRRMTAFDRTRIG